jgi:hypothetical protein
LIDVLRRSNRVSGKVLRLHVGFTSTPLLLPPPTSGGDDPHRIGRATGPPKVGGRMAAKIGGKRGSCGPLRVTRSCDSAASHCDSVEKRGLPRPVARARVRRCCNYRTSALRPAQQGSRPTSRRAP